jgi:hypothetical protein
MRLIRQLSHGQLLLLQFLTLLFITVVSLSNHGLPPQRCEVHGGWMKVDSVPYAGGSMNDLMSEPHPFPNANDYFRNYSGNWMHDGKVRYGYLRYCPRCRDLKRAYFHR